MRELLPCRLILDGAASGAGQMAVDEVLLAGAAAAGTATLRFYRFDEPTLSLGYFQSYADRSAHPTSAGCPLVRRATGGGAILHDREITYSLALPAAAPLARDARRLYDAAHKALAAALAQFGVPAVQLVSAPRRDEPEPFLCFERRTNGDLLVDGSKICGSAQWRRRGAILLHGSLLLASSPAAPELPGISELCGVNLPANAWIEAAVTEVAREAGLSLTNKNEPAGDLRGAAERLAVEKYASPEWNRRR